MEDVIDTEIVPRQEIATVVKPDGEIVTAPPVHKTALQHRDDQVSAALVSAYAKAGTLDLTDEEIAALAAQFPDEAYELVEKGKKNFLYLAHTHIERRLNQVFKPGKWTLVRRREWYDAPSKTIYGDFILVVRGVYVGDCIQGHEYFPGSGMDFGDALEAAASRALPRIAGKRLGVGAECWLKSFREEWKQRQAAPRHPKAPPENAAKPAQKEAAPFPPRDLIEKMKKAAALGKEALNEAYFALSKEERKSLLPEKEYLRQVAEDADNEASI